MLTRWELFAWVQLTPEEWWCGTAVGSHPLWSWLLLLRLKNWLREQCRTAFGELNIEHCGFTWIVTALYEAQKRKGKTHLRIYYLSIHIKASKMSTDILYFNCSKSARRGNLISLGMILLEPPSLASLSMYFASRLIFLITGLSRSNSQAQEFILSPELKHFKFYTLAFSLVFIIHQSLRARFSIYKRCFWILKEPRERPSCHPPWSGKKWPAHQS